MSGLEFETSWIPTMGIGELSGMPDEMLVLRGVGGGGGSQLAINRHPIRGAKSFSWSLHALETGMSSR